MKVKLFLLISLFLAGCTTGNYQRFNDGVGYQETQLNTNEYNVTYTGTRSTNIKKVNDFVLLRSAEITLENGYKYFMITEAKNNRYEVGSTRSSSTEVAMIENRMPSIPGTWAGSNSPQAKSEMIILMYNEKPDGIAYDAKQIETALKNEYQIDDEI